MTSIALEETRALLEDERRRLTQIRDSLAAEAREGNAEEGAAGELSSADQHLADLASDTFERERDLSILAHVDAQLVDVARAMERLESGTYGTCEACGQPIDADRLRARPAARLCVDDQAKRERAAT